MTKKSQMRALLALAAERLQDLAAIKRILKTEEIEMTTRRSYVEIYTELMEENRQLRELLKCTSGLLCENINRLERFKKRYMIMEDLKHALTEENHAAHGPREAGHDYYGVHLPVDPD